jgi:hypothetical protein
MQPEWSPPALVEACLDLLGSLAVRERTRAALIKFVSQSGPLCFAPEAGEAEQRVGELLSLIAATREFQMG